MAAPTQGCIVLFGDSLTERQDVPGTLHEKISQSYCRKLDVLNRGLGGYNTTLARPLLEHIFAKKGETAQTVRLVTIWFGANDACLPPNVRAVPLSSYRENLDHFVESLTNPSKSPYAISETPINIILITPPPIFLPQIPQERQSLRRIGHSSRYAQVVREVGEDWKSREESKENTTDWKIAVLDLWSAIEAKAGGSDDGLAPFFHDGVHMTTQGYEVLWGLFDHLIHTEFKGRGLDWQNLDDLPRRIPWWDAIDLARPASVLERLGAPRSRR
ncbi:hypothetical protein IAR55_004002 [Kwoniella newhampshirensis]|uniref:SGNH hydrolase-type esterase domain-containing protein n=1 Tax=Kwoniella newhampshirensis TaxID=1651941 RepID=A0AAW0YPS2_9TREE